MPACPPVPAPRHAPQKLPIGIQTFREIREDNCYYVDKTAFALKGVEFSKRAADFWSSMC